jgi:hypothetical protein
LVGATSAQSSDKAATWDAIGSDITTSLQSCQPLISANSQHRQWPDLENGMV